MVVERTPFTTLEIRIHGRRTEGYPLELTLDEDQVFAGGHLTADLLPWASEGDSREDGVRLFHALFGAGAAREAWIAARQRAADRGTIRRLRLRIAPEAAELHTLPWELMVDPDEGIALAAAPGLAFSRFLPVALPWRGTLQENTIRVLVAISNPDDLPRHGLAPLDVEAERTALVEIVDALKREALAQHLTFPYRLSFTFLEPPITLPRLEKTLQQGHPVLHYIGHGLYNPRRQQAALCLQDENGHLRLVRDDELAHLVSRQTVRPQLIFLAACQSATRSTTDAFLGLAPKLIRVGVPAVVAMQGFVTVPTARALNHAFYRHLVLHGQVDRALNQARSLLVSQGRVDAAVPVLLTRLRSGQLWAGEADQRGTPGQKPTIFWSGLIRMLQRKRCLPIIGPHVHGPLLPRPSEIAARWAEQHGYPFRDTTRLPRVAQYLASNQGEDFPRYEYLDALTTALWERLPEALRPTHKPSSPTELIAALAWHDSDTDTPHQGHKGWASLVAGDPNEPHTVLAALDLPLYLTTNADGFMAEALQAEGKQVRREICRWKADLDFLPSVFEDDPDYEPTPQAPLVYHLFGSDEEPDSLVLTEDSYMAFLVNTAAERDRIPNYIQGALANSTLLLLGYSLYDWEFRVVMNGLIRTLDQRRRFKHIAVQLDVDEMGITDKAAVQTFLQQYLQEVNVNIFWGTLPQFIAELRERWEAQP